MVEEWWTQRNVGEGIFYFVWVPGTKCVAQIRFFSLKGCIVLRFSSIKKKTSSLKLNSDSNIPPARLTLLKKNSKNYETSGLHSLAIRLQMCAINFPLSLNSAIKLKKSILTKNNFFFVHAHIHN
jgi:hypothetical protein